MDIQQKIDGLAIFDIGWVTWLISGFAVGGTVMLLDRLICLVVCRLGGGLRRWDARRRRCPRPLRGLSRRRN